MKIPLITLLLITLQFTAISQTIKFNKEIQPLIDNKTYTVESKNLAVQYHSQNTNPDGTLTDKAILVSYDNVYNTRVFLGLCFYSIGVTNQDPAPLDSSLFYLNLAQGMAGVNDVSTLINGVAKKQNELVIFQKNKAIKAEEDARKEKYALKTIEVSYKSAEFIGHCRVIFVDADGNEIVFYNPALGKYEDNATNCGIMSDLMSEKFTITHQLETIEVYSEDAGSSKFENPVLKSIVLVNKDKEQQLNADLVKVYKQEMTMLIDEAINLNILKPEEITFYKTLVDTLTIVNWGAEGSMMKLESNVKFEKSQREYIENLETELAEKASAFGIEQKKIISAVSCSSCPKKVLHTFFIALQNNDMPSVKKQMSECCYSSTATGCNHRPLDDTRPLAFSKLVGNPQEGIAIANKWLEAEDRWFVYFESATIAKVIITPTSENYSKMYYFMLILENGLWKVFGADDTESRYYIAKYAQEQ